MASTSGIFAKKLRLAVKESTIEVQEEARAKHRYKTRTGALDRAVQSKFEHKGLVGRVFINTGEAKYGAFVHEGTRPHTIFPKERKSLRFVKGGKFMFAKHVNHPGTHKDQFLFSALINKQERVSRIFRKYTEESLEEVASGISGSGLSRTFTWGR